MHTFHQALWVSGKNESTVSQLLSQSGLLPRPQPVVSIPDFRHGQCEQRIGERNRGGAAIDDDPPEKSRAGGFGECLETLEMTRINARRRLDFDAEKRPCNGRFSTIIRMKFICRMGDCTV
jgi:hypothetical protein